MDASLDADAASDAVLRRFAWIFAALVALLFGLALPWLGERPWPWWPWAAAAAFVLWGLVAPTSVRGFYRLWMRFGQLMSRVTTRLVLAIVFYLVVLPTGLLLRLRGRDPLRRTWRSPEASYRVASRARAADDMRKPF
jgi:hypothetical protein